MTVAVQQPQRVRKDPLEVLAQGLGIANSAFGIATDMTALQDHAAKQEEMQAMKERLARGEKTPQELEAAAKDFDVVPSTPDDKGPLHTYVVDANGQRQDFSLIPKKQSGLTFDQQVALKKLEHPDKPDKGSFKATGMLDDQGRLILADDSGAVKFGPVASKAAGDKEPKPTQYQAATFGRRVESANNIFNQLADSGFDRTTKSAGFQSILPTALQGAASQQQEQAERNFVNAVLRRESGSAISKTEFDSAEKQYFPRAGDSPEVLAQKAQNRSLVQEGLRAESGNAWNEVPQVSLMPPKKKGEAGTAIAGPKKGSALPGTVVEHGGKQYTVGADGDTLIPIGKK